MLQSALEAAFGSLDAIPILDGILVEGIEVSTSERRILHGLKRKPKGFIVVDNDNNCLVYRSSESTNKYLHLSGSRVANISLWVF